MTLLQVLRSSKRLSQCELAHQLGVSNVSLCKIERDPRIDNQYLSRRVRARLEQFFKQPIEKLLAPIDVAKLLN